MTFSHLGPSNARDLVGRTADTSVSIPPRAVDGLALFGVYATDAVNRRSRALEGVREARAASFDYYVAVRDAYFQLRQARIQDSRSSSASAEEDPYDEDDLYFDEEDPYDDGFEEEGP